MRKAKFKVRTSMEMASYQQEGTVTIDRGNNLVEVRPKHARRTYSMLLDDVASIIVNRNIMAELKEKKRAKALGKK